MLDLILLAELKIGPRPSFQARRLKYIKEQKQFKQNTSGTGLDVWFSVSEQGFGLSVDSASFFLFSDYLTVCIILTSKYIHPIRGVKT